MKVRCSNGLQVSSYHGNFVQHALGADLEIGSVDADKGMGVVFSYDGKLDSKLDAHFQAALLYTSADGQRRVRCINVVAAVNDGGMETMKYVDQDAVVAVIAKEGKFMARPIFVLDIMLIYASQRPPRHSKRTSRIFAPASRRRPWTSLAATARSSPGRIHRANWCCRRT